MEADSTSGILDYSFICYFSTVFASGWNGFKNIFIVNPVIAGEKFLLLEDSTKNQIWLYK